jgi:hypothetical protein
MGLAAFFADARNDRPFNAANHVRVIRKRLDRLYDVLDLGLCCMRLHYDNHVDNLSFSPVQAKPADAIARNCAPL